jgi:hypothetical protein
VIPTANAIVVATENANDVAPDGLVVATVVARVVLVVVAVLIAQRAHSPSKHDSVTRHTVGPLYKVNV